MTEPNAVAVAREWRDEVADHGEYAQVPITSSELRTICTALLETDNRARRLHEALRDYSRWCDGSQVRCDLCGGTWVSGKTERHAPNCLAAPLAEEGTK